MFNWINNPLNVVELKNPIENINVYLEFEPIINEKFVQPDKHDPSSIFPKHN